VPTQLSRQYKSSSTTAIYPKPLGNMTYDKNGNITTLKRKGGGDAQIGAMVIDDLSYTYQANTNKLLNVFDNSNNTSGFNDGNTVATITVMT
jgi:hypothetical protein